jgi:hypothetical protein
LGEQYVPTDLSTGQIGTWAFVHIEGDVKLYIISGGRRFLMRSWVFGAGVCESTHTNFEIFVFGGTICTHNASHRAAMDMGAGAY